MFVSMCRSTTVPHHLMDEDEISVSGHSVGIVENPLFADDDTGGSGPTYAALRAKEKKKEAEVSINQCCTLLKNDCWYM